MQCGGMTGYTTLAMALSLPEGGKIVACDISDEYATIGAKPASVVPAALHAGFETLQTSCVLSCLSWTDNLAKSATAGICTAALATMCRVLRRVATF